ncbi:MAG: DUF4344 domain-containing metallopeptidase [Pseudomonadota bacterium]
MFRLARYAWTLLSFGFVLHALSPAAKAVDGEGRSGLSPDDDAVFIIGNTLFTIYHELGHALIDLLNLPVIGREEDAVDGFAAVTMIPETADALRDALIVAVADGWRAQSELAAVGGAQPYWGKHALDEQRYFAIVCLMVGSDQDGFYDYALEAGLPEERIASCADDFARMETGWKQVLDPYERGLNADIGSAGTTITIAFDDPLPEQEGLYRLIQDGGLLEDGIQHLADRVDLPVPVVVRFSVCNRANAYWSRSRREVQICYELIDEFEAILSGTLTR